MRPLRTRQVHLPKGFARIEYATREQAEAAILHMDGAQIDGGRVSVAFTRPPSPPPLPPPPPPPPRGGSGYGGGYGGREGREGYGGYGGRPGAGVCFDFQKGRCTRASCRFEHTGAAPM